MNEILYFIVTFIVIFILYYLFAISRKKYLDKLMTGKEVNFLKYKYHIKVNDQNKKKLGIDIALANSFILSFTIFIVSFIKNIILELILGVIVLVILIFIVYSIIGRKYRR